MFFLFFFSLPEIQLMDHTFYSEVILNCKCIHLIGFGVKFVFTRSNLLKHRVLYIKRVKLKCH